jgi:Ca2+-transporting ATPase
LLWLNLVTDGAPALALATEKGDPDIMSRKPRPKDEPIINRFMQMGILIQTIAITGVTLAAYFLGLKLQPNQPEFAEAMAFVTLSLSELVRAYTARSEYYPLLKIGIFSNRNMNLALIFSAALIFAVIYIPFFNPIFNTVPLGWAQWQVLLPLLLVPSIAAEAVKLIAQRRKRTN